MAPISTRSSFFASGAECRWLSGLLAVVLGLLLSGCAFGPGVNYARELARDPALASQSTWNSYVRDVLGFGEEDPPPPGALISVTPELIRKQRDATPQTIASEVSALFAATAPYTIGAGDLLSITVWDHPELNLPTLASSVPGQTVPLGALFYPVDSQGRMQFPMLGAVQVGGLTEEGLRALLVRELSRSIKNPVVTVRIQSYRAQRIYVDGEVRNPGLLNGDDLPPTLPQMLARAGGFTPQADRSRIAVTRGEKTTTISLPQLTRLGVNPGKILLAHGDLVRVFGREESKVYVLGEVIRPSTQTLRDGRLTLNEALGVAGGLNPTTANPRQVFVIRAASAGKPEIYHLDASAPAALALAEGFELKASDVVYVDPVPVVRWNRVISLILPSAAAVTTTGTAVNAFQ
jgi:polysaccharide export outer membrane protein